MATTQAPVPTPTTPAPAPPRAGRRDDDAVPRALVPAAWAAYVGLNTFPRAFFPQAIDEAAVKGPKLLIDPAPWAFAIWGPIFAGQGVLAAYQASAMGRANPRVRAARAPLAASFAFGALWPVAIGADRFDLAAGALAGMLATGVVAYRRLRPAGGPPADPVETAAARVPTSVYVGWLTLAGLISATTVAVRYAGARPVGLGAEGWAALGIGAAGATAAAVAYTQRDPAYAAPIAWGLVAIAFRQRRPAITRAVGAAVALAAAGVAAGLARR